MDDGIWVPKDVHNLTPKPEDVIVTTLKVEDDYPNVSNVIAGFL